MNLSSKIHESSEFRQILANGDSTFSGKVGSDSFLDDMVKDFQQISKSKTSNSTTLATHLNKFNFKPHSSLIHRLPHIIESTGNSSLEEQRNIIQICHSLFDSCSSEDLSKNLSRIITILSKLCVVSELHSWYSLSIFKELVQSKARNLLFPHAAIIRQSCWNVIINYKHNVELVQLASHAIAMVSALESVETWQLLWEQYMCECEVVLSVIGILPQRPLSVNNLDNEHISIECPISKSNDFQKAKGSQKAVIARNIFRSLCIVLSQVSVTNFSFF
jgi:hypothetical protein